MHDVQSTFTDFNLKKLHMHLNANNKLTHLRKKIKYKITNKLRTTIRHESYMFN